MPTYGYNRVVLVGKLGKDPVLQYVKNDLALTKIQLVVSEDQDMKPKETNRIEVVFWGNQAEIVHQNVRKGSSILVEGKLKTSVWETPQGEKRSRLEVHGDRWVFLEKHTDTPTAQPLSGANQTLGTTQPFSGLGNAPGTDDLPF